MGKFNEQQGFLLFLIFNRDSFLTGREKLRGFARRRSFQSREFFLDRSNLFDREISRKIKLLLLLLLLLSGERKKSPQGYASGVITRSPVTFSANRSGTKREKRGKMLFYDRSKCNIKITPR